MLLLTAFFPLLHCIFLLPTLLLSLTNLGNLPRNRIFRDHPGSSPPLWGHRVLTDDTQYNNWDLESFLHTSLPVLLQPLPPLTPASPNVSGVYRDGIIQRTSEYLPIGFPARLISAEFFQRWAKSNSDYNKPKLLSDLWAVSWGACDVEINVGISSKLDALRVYVKGEL